MSQESRGETFSVANVRLEDRKAEAIAARFGDAVQVEEETFVVPVCDEEGRWVCDTHFMRHVEIPWEPIRGGIPVEQCLAAAVKYGLAMHRGELSLYDAVQKVRAEKA